MIFSESVVFLSFSFSYSLVQRGAISQTFEAGTFGFVGTRIIELQVLLLLNFLQRKPWSSNLFVRATIKYLFQKFDSFACAFQGTVVDILLTILKSFA